MALIDTLAELETLHQFDVLGGKLPPGPSAPNPVRAAGMRYFEARRREGVAPAKLYDERGEAWGCAALAIPELDRAVFRRRFPELDSKDRDTRRLAWAKFMRDYGARYGVDASIGKRKAASRIIVK